MNEQDDRIQPDNERTIEKRSLSRLTIMAAILVVLLAAGSLLWPKFVENKRAHVLLVFDSSGENLRVQNVYARLGSYLSTHGGQDLEVVVAANRAEFLSGVASRPDYVFAPDRLAMQLSLTEFTPLVTGRRRAPYNLRPRSIVVFRRSAGEPVEPWVTSPSATVFGDSISLSATAALKKQDMEPWPKNLSVGPDTYDHGSVLHALRLGGFDYAVVRQWDVERFFDSGLLQKSEFGMRELSAPVPDVVLLMSRKVSAQTRLQLAEELSVLGRGQENEGRDRRELRESLQQLRLTGFNLLMEPDWDLARNNRP